MAYILDYEIVVSKFKFQSHFQNNTLRKSMNPIIPPAMG